MPDVACAQHALDDELVHHPVPHANRQETEHGAGPGHQRMVRRLPHRHAIVSAVMGQMRRTDVQRLVPDAAGGDILVDHILEAINDAARCCHRLQRQDGEQGDAADLDDGGQDARPGHGVETAIDRPAAGEDAGANDAPQKRPSEEAGQRQPAGIHHRRHEDGDVGEDSQQGESQTHPRPEALGQIFRHGGDAGPDQERHEQEDDDDLGQGGLPLGQGGRHAEQVAGADQADEMLGGDIGGDIGAAHHIPGQPPSGQKIVAGRAALAAAGDKAHHAQRRQEDEKLDIIERQHGQGGIHETAPTALFHSARLRLV